jgi:hypothetical protein
MTRNERELAFGDSLLPGCPISSPTNEEDDATLFTSKWLALQITFFDFSLPQMNVKAERIQRLFF